MKKNRFLWMLFGASLLLLIAAVTPIQSNFFTSPNYNGTSSATARSYLVAAGLTDNNLFTGRNTTTNNPWFFQPLVQYVTNDPITFTANSPFITAPSGTWDRYTRGMNINPSAGTNNDQYTYIGKISATIAEVYPAGQHNYTADSGCVIYPNSIMSSDVNGGTGNFFFGLAVDSGGLLSFGDASGAGNGPPSIILTSPSLQYYDGAVIDLVSSGTYGPIIILGGNQGESSLSRWSWFVSTTAKQFSGGVDSNSFVDAEHGITNDNNGSGGGTVNVLGMVSMPGTNFAHLITFPSGQLGPTNAANQTDVTNIVLALTVATNQFVGTNDSRGFTNTGTAAITSENVGTSTSTNGYNVPGSTSYDIVPATVAGGAGLAIGSQGAESLLLDRFSNVYPRNGYYLDALESVRLAPTANGSGIAEIDNGATGTYAPLRDLGTGSFATAVPVQVKAGGITNNFSVNAKLFLTATAVTYTNSNNAGTAYLTNTTTGTLVLVDVLQPGAKCVAASGLSGTLVPE